MGKSLMSHNERCKECKVRVRQLLEKIYGPVITNYRIPISTKLEDFRDHPRYPILNEIYTSLQKHRGFTEFVRASYVDVDFFLLEQKMIIEFDESQHFTEPRKIALSHYPSDLNIGYSREAWMKHCDEIRAYDNDPPYRDEQRAWYDTLRDFIPEIKGFQPTVRLYAKDMEWCRMDRENPDNVKKFKNIFTITDGSEIDTLLDTFESALQNVKTEYLHWAIDKDNNGIGAPENNHITAEFLTNHSQKIKTASSILHQIRNYCRTITDPKKRYRIIREVYCIQPSFHELWFFDRHFNLFYEPRLGGIYSRLGLISIGTSIKRGTFPERIKAVSTFMLKWVILLDNLYAGTTNLSLFDFAPVNDEKLFQNIQNLQKNPNPRVKEVIQDLPVIYETALTILDRTGYYSLNPDIILNDDKILLYAPCAINEGPVFYKTSNDSRSEIFKRINTDDISIIRKTLMDHFTVLPLKIGQKQSLPSSSVSIKKDTYLDTGITRTTSGRRNSSQSAQQINHSQEVFSDRGMILPHILTIFDQKHKPESGLKRTLNRTNQCRYSIISWPKIDGKPTKSIFYEFNDWINQGKPEISVEIEFWTEAFGNIGEIVQQNKETIGNNMQGDPTVEWDTTRSPGWGRLKFVFPDTTNPEIVAQSMQVLIEETKETINDWLTLKNMGHY